MGVPSRARAGGESDMRTTGRLVIGVAESPSMKTVGEPVLRSAALCPPLLVKTSSSNSFHPPDPVLARMLTSGRYRLWAK